MAFTPPIFQYSQYPDKWNYNDGKVSKSNPEIIKKIDIENNFSDYMSIDMRSKRYGVNACCSFSQLEESIIKKELCDWQDIIKPVITKEYEDQAWGFGNEPWPEWLQFGDYDPAIGPCINNDCETYEDPYGSTQWAQLNIRMDTTVQQSFTPTGDWAGATAPNVPPINQSGTAVLYVLATRAPGNVTDWYVIGKSKIPTGPDDDVLGDGGNLWTNPDDGQDYWRIHCYYNLPTTGVTDGGNSKAPVRFVVVDGDIQYEVKFDEDVWPTENGTPAFNDYHVYPEANYGVPYCFACIEQFVMNKTPRFQKICDDTFEECFFCGMEAVYANYTSTPSMEGEAPLGFQCVNDSECIHIDVVNQFGVPVVDYPIILDGDDVGSTDENGTFQTVIENASVNNMHTINICEFCFYTTGGCNQHYIKITINDPRAFDFCKPNHVNLVCSDTMPDIQVVDEDTPEDTLTSWLCDNNGTTYYGCVEIIGNYGYATQEECVEACVPPPPPEHYRCTQLKGSNEYQCLNYYGENPGCASCYDTLEECEAVPCEAPIPIGCWRCSEAPEYIPVWSEGEIANNETCFDSVTAFNAAVEAGTFCVAPAPYYYQGCGCNQFPNVFFLPDGSGDTVPWTTAEIGIINGNLGNEPLCPSYPENPCWFYPFYTTDNIPSTVLDEYSTSVFNDISPTSGGISVNNHRMSLIPIMWPGTDLFAECENCGDPVGDYNIGSNLEFTLLIVVEGDETDGGMEVVVPFGTGANWANDNLDTEDHEKLFYIINKNEVLSEIGLQGCSFGSATGAANLTDFYSGNGSDHFIDYITVSPNTSYGMAYGQNQGGSRYYYIDIKFDYNLAMSQGGVTAAQMPSMAGRVFYLPIYIVSQSITTPGFDLSYEGRDNKIIYQFLPNTNTNSPWTNDYYCTAVNGVTGEAVSYQINNGNEGVINGCDPSVAGSCS